MKKPDIELRVEVREDAIYMMAQVIHGAGGMPVGSNGQSLLMFSGGIDSPVAGIFNYETWRSTRCNSFLQSTVYK